MYDNALGHATSYIMEELRERGITIIYWPPFLLDLNPIETIWNQMKDYIGNHFPEKISYDRLREAVKEAWESIGKEVFEDLIKEIGERC
jgi:transposase